MGNPRRVFCGSIFRMNRGNEKVYHVGMGSFDDFQVVVQDIFCPNIPSKLLLGELKIAGLVEDDG